MASVGEQLRTAREKQGLSIAQIADRTKLRSDHVRALEEGNYDVFAAPVYVRGFVRSYASLLRLDSPRVLRDLEAELSQSPRLQESTLLVKPTPTAVDILMLQLSKVRWGITAVVVLMALAIYLSVLGFRAWRTHKARDPLAGLSPGLYQPRVHKPGEFLPLPNPAPRP